MSRVLHLAAGAAERIRADVARARGNEVCFVAQVGEDGEVTDPRPVARGHRQGVLAAVRDVAAGMLVIHNHPSGALEPSDPDLEIAASLHERGVGLAITDNDARELYVVVEPTPPRSVEELDTEAIAGALSPAGPVAAAHPNYEDRPAQRELASAVARAYNRGVVLLAEAGTGTGKSVAYLVPAIGWARSNKERTVVSTNTINLQEQLVTRDLPFLRRALGIPFRFALVKGRRNYVSIRRARLAAEGAGALFDEGRRAELDAILAWVKTTREGSLQDLPFNPSAEVWDEVASETDVCLRARCPHFEQCFYQRARRDAAAADILVVNHHLLFSDLAARRVRENYTAPAVLPPYARLVLDEAHNLEDAATEHLGATASRTGVLRLLSRLDRRGRGVLQALAERLRAGRADLVQQDALRRIEKEARPGVARSREHAQALFEALAALAADGESVVRLDENRTAEPDWAGGVIPAAEALVVELGQLARKLNALGEAIRIDSEWARALEERLVELAAAADRTRAAEQALRTALWLRDAEVPMVRWIERRGAGPDANVAVRAAPVEIAGLLRDALFERVDSVVLTSATLTTRAGFTFLRSRLGLADPGLDVREQVYASPFDFAAQTVVAVPTDLTVPGGESSPAFDLEVARVVHDLAAMTDGGLFVLFTSYRSMAGVAAELRRRGAGGRWPLFVQGDAGRARLLETFTKSGRGILLGVASFWEGVDVPGEPLRGLVIPKLPFRVPGEPLTAARIEAVEAAGGSGFRDYLLPHAALRLKQGFGRLVRTRADRGAVVLLDRRVLERSYGRYLLGSLPPAPVLSGRWTELRARLAGFYGVAAACRDEDEAEPSSASAS